MGQFCRYRHLKFKISVSLIQFRLKSILVLEVDELEFGSKIAEQRQELEVLRHHQYRMLLVLPNSNFIDYCHRL